jgi:uncharacterized protein with HEPN domain
VNARPTYLTDTEPDAWRDAVDMRNFLSYEYFRVRADIVRQTIDVPLTELQAECERLLDTQEQGR